MVERYAPSLPVTFHEFRLLHPPFQGIGIDPDRTGRPLDAAVGQQCNDGLVPFLIKFRAVSHHFRPIWPHLALSGCAGRLHRQSFAKIDVPFQNSLAFAANRIDSCCDRGIHRGRRT